MATYFEALQQFVLVAVCCFAASSANPIMPITMPPTTAMPTVIVTTQSTYDLYLSLVGEIERFRYQFTPNFTLFNVSRFHGNLSSQKTDRLLQSDALAPDMDIRGFLTVKNDLPSTHERTFMEESELLPKHKLFLQTYEEVMRSLKTEEDIAVTTHPDAYTSTFTNFYDDNLMHIQRLEYKVSEMMILQGIDDGPSQTFDSFQAVPHNYQIHNTRSLYVLQSISLYIDASLHDYNVLLSRYQS